MLSKLSFLEKVRVFLETFGQLHVCPGVKAKYPKTFMTLDFLWGKLFSHYNERFMYSDPSVLEKTMLKFNSNSWIFPCKRVYWVKQDSRKAEIRDIKKLVLKRVDKRVVRGE